LPLIRAKFPGCSQEPSTHKHPQACRSYQTSPLFSSPKRYLSATCYATITRTITFNLLFFPSFITHCCPHAQTLKPPSSSAAHPAPTSRTPGPNAFQAPAPRARPAQPTFPTCRSAPGMRNVSGGSPRTHLAGLPTPRTAQRQAKCH
jgi:hypothetical protein